MDELRGRLKREHDTIVSMTRIYCAHHHVREPGTSMCPECGELVGYAFQRLRKCPYGPEKPTCANCPVHCYKRPRREEVCEIMRFSGPRMAWRHPLQSLMHLLDKRRRAEHPIVSRLRESRRGK